MTSLDFFTNAEGLTAWLWDNPETREDLRKTRASVRRFISENREMIDAEAAAMTSPPRTIEGHVASLRDADPARWQQLQAEWLNREDNTDV